MSKYDQTRKFYPPKLIYIRFSIKIDKSRDAQRDCSTING